MFGTKKHLSIHASKFHHQLDRAVWYNLYTGLAYGTFVAVYLISMRILLSKGCLFRSPEHMFLFGITTITFILCTTVIILGPGLASQSIPSMIKTKDPSFDEAWSPHKIHLVEVIIAFITRLVPILSDLVCVWRAIVLWRYDRRVVTILSISFLGTFVACIYGLTFTSQTAPINQNVQNLSPERDIAVVVIGPILATNVLATTFIAWRAWDYHRTVGTYFRKGRSSGRVEKVLVLLIESGFVYCILWTLYLLNTFGILRVHGNDSMLTTFTITVIMLFISGTYPVSINVLAVTTQSCESSEMWIQSVQY